ncbi:hypothetical protein [Sphingomonas quercus]|uniref:Periplasmic heavy metal sensor n=1 Tax=Sphingomonas quercus TaxID=2842451 RepID=A0ABS6BQB6_9SPHN|nr:hypothetical protein [Sphingomonas quercus]MBU3079405.1 hypothetical protein [Sphingomonas quercus]
MLLALMIALQAATPAAPAAAPGPPPRYLQQMRQFGMTEAGIAVLQRLSAPDPDAPAYAARRQALRDRLRTIATANPIDVEGFAGLLKAEAQAEGEARVRVAEKIAETMRALPPEDRQIFARVVLAQSARAAPAPAATQKP